MDKFLIILLTKSIYFVKNKIFIVVHGNKAFYRIPIHYLLGFMAYKTGLEGLASVSSEAICKLSK